MCELRQESAAALGCEICDQTRRSRAQRLSLSLFSSLVFVYQKDGIFCDIVHIFPFIYIQVSSTCDT
jgi:hypothetical protein